jgi:hypothetical protein
LWIAAQRFFVAATIAARPASLNFRLALGAAFGADSPAAVFASAHRFFWASPIRFLAAALIFRRLPLVGSGVLAAISVGPAPGSNARSSAILELMFRICSSNPMMAAEIIGCVSFGGMAFSCSLYSVVFGSNSHATPTRSRKEGAIVCISDVTIHPVAFASASVTVQSCNDNQSHTRTLKSGR